MLWYDWIPVIGLVLFLAYMVQTTRKYNRTVADFLSANRCGGRYLVGAADGIAGMGAVSIIMIFETNYQTGFAYLYWAAMAIPIMLIVRLSGYIIYRYRSTRAMTMGQFFEMRYSRKFRLFAGFMAWTAGVINFGIFPGVGTEFFITFCGLPETLNLGFVSLPTFDVVLIGLLLMVFYFTLTGGQISVLVMDFWQAMFSLVVFAVVIVFLWASFSWSDISEGLKLASPSGASLINPFETGAAEDFNIYFYLILWFWTVYRYEAWHGNQGFECAAASPHEQKMAQVCGALRGTLIDSAVLFIPVIALTIMHLPAFQDIANTVNERLFHLYPGLDELAVQARKRNITSTVLSTILPAGMLGFFAAAMLGFLFSTHNTYIHAWGVIGVQDFYMPTRKKPLSPKAHMLVLRLSIVMVGVIIAVISKTLPLQEYIQMFFMLTGAVYIGGAGVAIVGGLYTKRGNTYGAFAGMITGATIALIGGLLLFDRLLHWEDFAFLHAYFPTKLSPDGSSVFPYNGTQVCFAASALAITAYIMVSLLTPKPNLDFDKLFHRGKHAVKGEMQDEEHRSHEGISRWWRMIGVNSHEFTRWDRFLYIFVISQSLLQIFSFIVLGLLHFFTDVMTLDAWMTYWFYYLVVSLVFGFTGGVWICIGGFHDLIIFYRRLREIERDTSDDGWVT